MKILIVVDMQNDFITGSLGTKEAQSIVPKIVDKVKNFDGKVFFTKDTHYGRYLETQEGKKLPIPHCIIDTKGWEIVDELKSFNNLSNTITKAAFGSEILQSILYNCYYEKMGSIELCGVCTGICVISNAIILKSSFPDIPITVDSNCCACVTPESHQKALDIMKLCQIEVM